MPTAVKPLKRVLVANRGEIAVRIIRALKDLEIESVAVYSDADRYSLHRRMADVAVNLPGETSADTYLNIPLLAKVIEETGADGCHPGYGFLAESAPFASAVAKAGAEFIGPTPEAMNLLGNKVEARNLMIKNKIPVVPGVDHPLKSHQELAQIAKQIGYPLILKAAQGGGGKGMQVVRKDEELEDAFAGCVREAQSYFGDDKVFCERFIENPRHIEVQILCDKHGHGVHLFERDCSVQRRHQKLFEEAPSAYLNPEQREKICSQAVRAALAAGYQGAGTVEFICESPDKAYFMEMNTRIQVEHPVSEMITGIDLIQEQILAAEGRALTFEQSQIQLNGWSLEARINAEDPTKGFLPGPGLVTRLKLPSGPSVRVDSHLYENYEIPRLYDSMIAKLIVWGRTRTEALARLRRALSEIEVEGVPTTVSFHQALLRHPGFLEGEFDTSLLVKDEEYFQKAFSVVDGDGMDNLLAALLASDSRRIEGKAPLNCDKWLAKSRMEASARTL